MCCHPSRWRVWLFVCEWENPRKLPQVHCHPLSSMRVKIELLTRTRQTWGVTCGLRRLRVRMGWEGWVRWEIERFQPYIARDSRWAFTGLNDFGGPMELRGYISGSVPIPKYFEYPNPQIHGWKSGTEPETRKPETRGYPPRTRSAAITKLGASFILIIKTCIKAILEKYPILKLNKITFALENWKYT